MYREAGAVKQTQRQDGGGWRRQLIEQIIQNVRGKFSERERGDYVFKARRGLNFKAF